jgi:glycosyltransferase involved in cell wall biosynthesis
VTKLNERPLVTVAMASFNSARTIRRAVDSVLGQDYSNIELLIFDAASKDETPAILQSLAASDSRIRLILREEQRSYLDAFAESLKKARGEFFCLLDGDDFMSPNWVGSLLERVRGSHFIGAFGRLLLTDLLDNVVTDLPSSFRTFRFGEIRSRNARLLAYVMAPENEGKVNLLYSLWRTDVIRQVGSWPSHGARNDDDYLFCLKMLNIGQVAYVEGPWICRTVPTASGSGRIGIDEIPILSQRFNCSPPHRKWSGWTFPPILQATRFTQSHRIGWLLSLALALRSALALSALPFRIWAVSSRRYRSIHDPK